VVTSYKTISITMLHVFPAPFFIYRRPSLYAVFLFAISRICDWKMAFFWNLSSNLRFGPFTYMRIHYMRAYFWILYLTLAYITRSNFTILNKKCWICFHRLVDTVNYFIRLLFINKFQEVDHKFRHACFDNFNPPHLCHDLKHKETLKNRWAPPWGVDAINRQKVRTKFKLDSKNLKFDSKCQIRNSNLRSNLVFKFEFN